MKRLLLLLLSLTLLACSAASDAYYAIDHFWISEEGDAFRESFETLTVATFEWYQGIEGEEGVYVVHYDHYSEELLREWQDIGYFETVPDSAVSYLVASPNYLADSGLALSSEDLELAASGVRLYLLPESLSDGEAAVMEAFLTEDALRGLDGGSLIDTTFARDRRIEFRRYSFDGTFKTFSEGEVADPVIYVATCANMRYFESESLIATGLADGYIKLTADAYERYAHDLPDEMEERQVTFNGVGSMRR